MLWDWPRVLACLAAVWVMRKVSATGQVSLYDYGYPLGREYAGQQVRVRFDADRQEWQFEQEAMMLCRLPAVTITPERVYRLDLGRRPGRARRRTAQRWAERGNRTASPEEKTKRESNP